MLFLQREESVIEVFRITQARRIKISSLSGSYALKKGFHLPTHLLTLLLEFATLPSFFVNCPRGFKSGVHLVESIIHDLVRCQPQVIKEQGHESGTESGKQIQSVDSRFIHRFRPSEN